MPREWLTHSTIFSSSRGTGSEGGRATLTAFLRCWLLLDAASSCDHNSGVLQQAHAGVKHSIA
jgi:hypothetical protein